MLNDDEYSPGEYSHVGCEISKKLRERMEGPLRRDKCESKYIRDLSSLPAYY